MMAACVSNQDKIFRWITDEESNAVVECGISPEYGFATSGTVDVAEHPVALGPLSPDTTYYYRIGSIDSSDITV